MASSSDPYDKRSISWSHFLVYKSMIGADGWCTNYEVHSAPATSTKTGLSSVGWNQRFSMSSLVWHVAGSAEKLAGNPRQLCGNARFDATDVLNKLRHKHASGEGANYGVDILTGGIADSLANFMWGTCRVKKAIDRVLSVL